jgi:predicted MFS family arabinose efflux permease
MHEVGEGWLMTSLTSSPLGVALLQSADSLAIFLLAIPAGALADVADRRRLGILTQAWMLGVAVLLGVLTRAHAMTPALLIGLTFVMGIGAAIDGPLWQVIVSEVVARRDLPQAVTLGGLSVNLARAFAPALGGLVVAAAGPFAVFLLNAATFGYVLVVLARWRPVKTRATAPAERWLAAMHGGLRYVRHSPELIAAFVRTGTSIFGGIGLIALLPLFARRSLGLDSAGFGALLGCMGAGAVLAAVVLPRVTARVTAEDTLSGGTLAFGAAVIALAFARAAWVAGALMVGAGLAWMSVISSLNVAVQLAAPSWVRARVLSVFLLVFQGAIALGSVTWGALAARTGLRTALVAGGATAAASLLTRVWFPLSARVPDFSPAVWPKPQLVCEPPEDAGPVLVTVAYRVPDANVARFAEVANELGRLRQRDGAYGWLLFRDPAERDELVEVYFVDSWAEHLRQHERVTGEALDTQKRLVALLVDGTEPVVRHLIALEDSEES